MEERPALYLLEPTRLLAHLCYKQVQPEPGLTYYLPMDTRGINEHAQGLVRGLAATSDRCGIIETFDL